MLLLEESQGKETFESQRHSYWTAANLDSRSAAQMTQEEILVSSTCGTAGSTTGTRSTRVT